MNKLLLSLTLLSPLAIQASNSNANARAPESQAIGASMPTPGMQALLDDQQQSNVERLQRKEVEEAQKEEAANAPKRLPDHQTIPFGDLNLIDDSSGLTGIFAAAGDDSGVKQSIQLNEDLRITRRNGYWGTWEMINLRNLALQYHKDYKWAGRRAGLYARPLDSAEKDIPFRDAIDHLHRYRLTGLISDHTALSFAALGGHIDVLDTLLAYLLSGVETKIAHTNRYKFIAHALDRLIHFSRIARSPDGKVWLKNLGIRNANAKCENYPIVALKLIAAFNTIKDVVDKANLRSDSMPSKEIAQNSLFNTTAFGSSDITRCIAAGFSVPTARPIRLAQDLNVSCEYHASHLLSGEKLGILLSTKAHPTSATYRISRGLLAHVHSNPILLERLKDYARYSQEIYQRTDRHLVPALASIVADYSGYSMEPEMARQILQIQPADTIEPNDESMLGENLTALLAQDRRTRHEELEEKSKE